MDDESTSKNAIPTPHLGSEFAEDTSSLNSMMGHFFRGEMSRVTTWRQRLDQTTNWAVTVMAAILTFAFSSSSNPHYLLLAGMLITAVFLFIETRRYRAFDVWRARVRLLEENAFAEMFDPSGGVQSDEWRTRLAADLRNPQLKIPFREALARRLRRVYLPLLLVLLVSWLLRITVFDVKQSWTETAAIFTVPGPVVVGVVLACYVALGAFAWLEQTRRAKGEFHGERPGAWKD